MLRADLITVVFFMGARSSLLLALYVGLSSDEGVSELASYVPWMDGFTQSLAINMIEILNFLFIFILYERVG